MKPPLAGRRAKRRGFFSSAWLTSSSLSSRHLFPHRHRFLEGACVCVRAHAVLLGHRHRMSAIPFLRASSLYVRFLVFVLLVFLTCTYISRGTAWMAAGGECPRLDLPLCLRAHLRECIKHSPFWSLAGFVPLLPVCTIIFLGGRRRCFIGLFSVEFFSFLRRASRSASAFCVVCVQLCY